MRKSIPFFFSFLMIVQAAIAQEYSILRIPAALMKNANAVIRLEEATFTIKNPGEAYFKEKQVITVLNENGDEYANFAAWYDKFIDIRSIEGVLYDSWGKEIKKLKNRDIQDKSGVDDISLFDDNRIKTHNFYHKVYPYTVEYEVEFKYNGTMFYPPWFPQHRSLVSVQQSRYTINCPEAYEFRYKAYQYKGEPAVVRDKGIKSFTWSISDLPAIVREPYTYGLRRLAPIVLFGPTEFEMEDYKGNMRTWQDLGKFFYALKQGRDVLPEDIKQAVHELTDKINDPATRVKLLYEYLQRNTRYISIQLGIGGWQPFDARFVATKRYGDCKALSNYMAALLKEAGIASNYAMINAGDGIDDIFTDFPSSQFNHVILCVPLQKDTIWLECTDQFKATGYMGGFTGNRHALIVDENGGKLVRTPNYSINDNRQLRVIKAKLLQDATLEAKVTTGYTGMQQDDIQFLINRLSKDKVKERLHKQFDFATYDISSFDYAEKKSMLPVIDESLAITVSNYATITGKRLFITPNVMTKTHRKLLADSTRKYDIVLNYPYKDVDSVEIELPPGYEPEAMPKDVALSSPFGKYAATVKLSDNKLVYYRSAEYYSGRFPATDYPELVKFYEAIYKADRARAVLVKMETEEKKPF
jgi:transglutaminase-like putative cysteine protease